MPAFDKAKQFGSEKPDALDGLAVVEEVTMLIGAVGQKMPLALQCFVASVPSRR